MRQATGINTFKKKQCRIWSGPNQRLRFIYLRDDAFSVAAPY